MEPSCLNIIDCNDLELVAGARGMGELQLERVRTGLDLIDVVVEPHVPDGENRGEQAVRADLRQNSFSKSCPE